MKQFHDRVLEHFWRGGCFFWLHQLLHPHLDSMIHEELVCKVRRHLKVGLWQKVIYCEYCRCERCESCRDRIECWALGIMGMAVYLQFCNFGVHWICMWCSWMQREDTHTLSLSLSLSLFWPFDHSTLTHYSISSLL
jgi:hypothetical protein